uniref:Uncharacterized protein n=1 Tax=Anguilla anguilla TaxID=7936 RepID=A0A0E9P9R5_ANGAN
MLMLTLFEEKSSRETLYLRPNRKLCLKAQPIFLARRYGFHGLLCQMQHSGPEIPERRDFYYLSVL